MKRRDFLRWLGIGAGSLAISPALSHLSVPPFAESPIPVLEPAPAPAERRPDGLPFSTMFYLLQRAVVDVQDRRPSFPCQLEHAGKSHHYGARAVITQEYLWKMRQTGSVEPFYRSIVSPMAHAIAHGLAERGVRTYTDLPLPKIAGEAVRIRDHRTGFAMRAMYLWINEFHQHELRLEVAGHS